MTTALCHSVLLVQSFEGLCAFGDTAVEQDLTARLSTVSLDPYFWTFALTAGYHNPDEVHEEIVPPEVISFWPTVCQALNVMIKHARSIVKNVSIDLAQGD